MARFLELLTQDYDLGEVIEIRCLKELRAPNTTRFAVHSIDDAVQHILQMNKTHNIYCVVNPVPYGVPKAAKDNDIKRAFLLSWMRMRGAQLIEQGRVPRHPCWHDLLIHKYWTVLFGTVIYLVISSLSSTSG